MSTRRRSRRGTQVPNPACTSDVQRPFTLDSIEDVISKLKDPKGTSANAILRNVQAAHPGMDVEKCKALLKAVLLEGLDSGRLLRPPGSKVGRGLVGRFLLKAGDSGKCSSENTAEKLEEASEHTTVLETLTVAHDKAVHAVTVSEERDTTHEVGKTSKEEQDTQKRRTQKKRRQRRKKSLATTEQPTERKEDEAKRAEELETGVQEEFQSEGTATGDSPAAEEENPPDALNQTFVLVESCSPAAYLQRVQAERERLAERCEDVTRYLRQDLPSTVLERVRIAIGQCSLITTNEKSPMARFEEQCGEAMTPDGDNHYRPTTNDLEACWDLVELQVQQIDGLFDTVHMLVKKEAVYS